MWRICTYWEPNMYKSSTFWKPVWVPFQPKGCIDYTSINTQHACHDLLSTLFRKSLHPRNRRSCAPVGQDLLSNEVGSHNTHFDATTCAHSVCSCSVWLVHGLDVVKRERAYLYKWRTSCGYRSYRQPGPCHMSVLDLKTTFTDELTDYPSSAAGFVSIILRINPDLQAVNGETSPPRRNAETKGRSILATTPICLTFSILSSSSFTDAEKVCSHFERIHVARRTIYRAIRHAPTGPRLLWCRHVTQVNDTEATVTTVPQTCA